MSGGSYDYFYSKAYADVEYIANTLNTMAVVCREIRDGQSTVWAHPPLTEEEKSDLLRTYAYLMELQHESEELGKKLYAVKEVLRAIEWRESGDSGERGIVEAYNKLDPALRLRIMYKVRDDHE